MKKHLKLARIGLCLALLLTGCSCKHQWIEATCTAPRMCGKCQEVSGEALGHAWAEATCTAPRTCTRCGTTDGSAAPHQWSNATCTAPMRCRNCHATKGDPLGHQWTPTVNLSGIEGRRCILCQEAEMPTYEWTPLTDCEKVLASNEDGHTADLVVGDWDSNAGRLPDAIRFCVANKESYRNTHYCIYKLNGSYNSLSGLISFSDKSEKFASAKILIYLDNELAYESSPISAGSSDQSFTLDVRGVTSVRVACSTTETHKAYCVLSASVY